MLNKNDKLIQIRLYSPHKCDFIYERENGSRYVQRKLDETIYYELHQIGDTTDWNVGEVISS